MTKKAYWSHYVNGRSASPMKRSQSEKAIEQREHKARMRGKLYWDSSKKGTQVKPE